MEVCNWWYADWTKFNFCVDNIKVVSIMGGSLKKKTMFFYSAMVRQHKCNFTLISDTFVYIRDYIVNLHSPLDELVFYYYYLILGKLSERPVGEKYLEK